jgi:cobalt-zinc-cadmium efflux system protein
VNKLHIWATSTQKIALTAHLVMADGGGDDNFLNHIAESLHKRFDIEQVTVQIWATPMTNE